MPAAMPEQPESIAHPFDDAEAFLAAFAPSSGGVVSFVDADERVRFITREAAAWLGKAPGDVVGRTLRELHEPTSYAFFAPYLRRGE